MLTVALIEGSNIGGAYSCGFSDPYVVFTCNGKTKTSSIKFQAANPVWNGNLVKYHFFHFVYLDNCSDLERSIYISVTEFSCWYIDLDTVDFL